MTNNHGSSIPIEISQSDEYRALEDAVQQYMDIEHEHGYDVWRALASVLGDALANASKSTGASTSPPRWPASDG